MSVSQLILGKEQDFQRGDIMDNWLLDAAFKIKADAEAFTAENTVQGWEYKVEEIGDIAGAYWGVYRREE